MKGIMFSFVFLCLIMSLKAQDFSEYNETDRVALNIPRSQAISTRMIAEYIKSHFDSDIKKVQAIYTWVTANIRYDTDSSNQINLGSNPEAKITEALRRRRGVCENYAAIFNDICLKSGLKSFVVNGYIKQSGYVDKTGHSWCTVRVSDNWYLFDPTWDEGRGAATSKYFMVPPSELIDSHIPFDPMWQLLNYPLSHQQFYSGNTYKKKDAPYFNYVDSINAFMQMDSLHRFQSSALRIKQNELYNTLVKDNYNVVKMNIEMINQDKDVNLYNSCVADMNDATSVLNNFIQYRNNKFIPEKTDAELQALLNGIDNKLNSAIKKLDEIDRSQATFQIGTQHVRDRINVLQDRVKVQKDFVQTYISTPKANRQALFYK